MRGFAGDGDPVAALLPQQEFQQALGVAVIDRNISALVGQDRRLENRDGAAAAFQREGELGPSAALCDSGAVTAHPEGSRDEVGIENRAELGGDRDLRWHEPRL